MSALNRSIAPDIKNFGALEIPAVRMTTLDNGIPLFILDNGSQEVNRLTLIWNGGICETSHPSIPTLTVNLIREGTQKRSGKDIAEILEFNGSWLKGNVHSHHSSIVAYSLNSKSDKVFPILAETISEPIFPQKEMSVLQEKMARTAELDREKVEFYSALENRYLVMGVNHPMANSDSPKDIRDITSSDIQSFYNRIYTPKSCGIYITGRITPVIEDLVNDNFGANKTNTPGVSLNIVPFTQSTHHEKVTKRSGSLQSSIRMSIPTITRTHNEYIALRIAVMALGGYFGSRLMTNIREDKGYTYGISASLLGYREGGIINIATQCANQYVKPLIHEVKSEITRMATGDFTKEELERLKKYAITQLASMLDSPFTIMDYYENMRLSGTHIDYFKNQMETINSISAERIAELTAKYMSISDIYTSISGDI